MSKSVLIHTDIRGILMTGSLPVQVFLLSLKKLCTDKRSIVLVHRQKNMQDMLRLNLTLSDIQSVCRSLTPSDLKEGPCADDNGSPEPVWIFLRRYEGVSLYVKLKIVNGKLLVLSFHE